LPEQILNHLKEKGGFSSINDKTPAETIYEIFRVSKKKYKIALGGLYKKRLITIHDDGIRLV
jgi:predicted RNA-binding protein (virulence factor B family)